MYEYKYSIRDVCFTPVETMGNLFDTSLFSDSKDHSANPVNILNAMMSSTFWGNPNQSENIQAWHACIDDIDSVNEDNLLVKSLRPEELQKVKRFRFPEDQKRALLSILLQRSLIRERFKINDSEYDLIRSKEGKPLVKSLSTHIDFNTWNFNVSHHGKYVCIVSHPCLLMGADIVDLSARSNMPCSGAMEYIEMFDSQLTALEMRDIQRQPTETARYCYFYLIWSLKEAFIKAIGQGLGFDLTQVEFSIVFEPGCDLNSQIDGALGKTTSLDSSAAATGSSSHCDVWVKGFATVRLRGELRDDWRMEFASLDSNHVMSVARGPLSAALPTFVQQAGWRLPVSTAHSPSAADHKHGFYAASTANKLGEKEISSQHQAHLALPMPACLRKTLSDLTPPTSITVTDTTTSTTTM